MGITMSQITMSQITMGNIYTNYYGQYIGFKLLWEIHGNTYAIQVQIIKLLWVIHMSQIQYETNYYG